MLNIESKRVSLNKPKEEVFEFLSDFNNFRDLLPEDKISDWESTQEECSFEINGLASIQMKMGEKNPHTYIQMESHGKVPFEFSFNTHLSDQGNGTSEAYIKFEGNVNAFLKPMISSPLTNFVNMLADKLEEINK